MVRKASSTDTVFARLADSHMMTKGSAAGLLWGGSCFSPERTSLHATCCARPAVHEKDAQCNLQVGKRWTSSSLSRAQGPRPPLHPRAPGRLMWKKQTIIIARSKTMWTYKSLIGNLVLHPLCRNGVKAMSVKKTIHHVNSQRPGCAIAASKVGQAPGSARQWSHEWGLRCLQSFRLRIFSLGFFAVFLLCLVWQQRSFIWTLSQENVSISSALYVLLCLGFHLFQKHVETVQSADPPLLDPSRSAFQWFSFDVIFLSLLKVICWSWKRMVGPSSTATGIVFICLLVHQAFFFFKLCFLVRFCLACLSKPGRRPAPNLCRTVALLLGLGSEHVSSLGCVSSMMFKTSSKLNSAIAHADNTKD